MFFKKTKAQREKEKSIRKAVKKVSKRKPRARDEKKVLRQIFNEYIRIRDCLDTTGSTDYCKCCTCGQIKPNSGAMVHAGHFVKSTHNACTFDPENVHGQCKKCNSFEGGREAEYSEYIIDKYGLKKFKALLVQKKCSKRFSKHELIDLQNEYSEKLNSLIKNEPYTRKSPKPTKLD